MKIQKSTKNRPIKTLAACLTILVIGGGLVLSLQPIKPASEPSTEPKTAANSTDDSAVSGTSAATIQVSEELKDVVYSDGTELIADDPAVQGFGVDVNGELTISKLQGEELSSATKDYIANSPRPIHVTDQIGRITTLTDDIAVQPTAVDITKSLIGGAPWMAGTTASSGLSLCSMGFPGYDASGNRVVITAGHCTGGDGSRTYMHGLTPASQPAQHGGGPAGTTVSTLNIANLDSWAFGRYGQTAGGLGAVDGVCRSDASTYNIDCYTDIAVYKAGSNAASWTDYSRVTRWNSANKVQNNLVNDSVTISQVAAPASGSVSRSGLTTGYANGVMTHSVIVQQICSDQSGSSCRIVSGFGVCIDVASGDSGGSVIQPSANGTFSAVGVVSGGGDWSDCTSAYRQPYTSWMLATNLSDALYFLRATDKANKVYRTKVLDPTVTTATIDSDDSNPQITGKAGRNTRLEITPSSGGSFSNFTVNTDSSGNWRFNYSQINKATAFKIRVFGTYEQSEWVSQTVTVVPSCSIGDTLAKGSSLQAGKCLRSANKEYKLLLQNDGNLVLYSASGTALWHTYTYGKGGGDVKLQNDGNLVIYTIARKALWHTSTYNQGTSRLKVQSDGNLVLYKNAGGAATWHTNTWSQGTSYLKMQNDGNLVLYKNTGGAATWHTNTWGQTAQSAEQFTCAKTGTLAANTSLESGETLCSPSKLFGLVMQADGNLVLYTYATKATWSRYSGVSP
ncbi:MAG: hypothetical protein LBL84_01995 [Candidatus Nomurabacteria bacterium]|nr:hypothetical protein [Candidatus Nomurabacteria bacterium]